MGATIKALKSVCCDSDEPHQIVQNRPIIRRRINMNDFLIEGKIGQGGFAVVFLSQLKQNIQNGIIEKYAMKRVSKEILSKKKVQQNTKLQKAILAIFDCKFIVTLKMAFQDQLYVYFVMQYATGGDTYSLIKQKSPMLKEYRQLGEKAVRFIAACVILGFQYLHENKIMYRDLKPQNVLMFDNGYVKLTDFGLAKKSQKDQISKTISGTIFYQAPEMILRLGYNLEIDFWAFGVYLYELSVLEPPFSKDQINRVKFQKAVIDAESNRNWKGANLSPEIKDLINGLLKYNPEVRLGHNGWKQVKQHQFFKDFDWVALQQMKMKSPIKQLVNKYPVVIKPYIPERLEQTDTEQQFRNFQGWTFIRGEIR